MDNFSLDAPGIKPGGNPNGMPIPGRNPGSPPNPMYDIIAGSSPGKNPPNGFIICAPICDAMSLSFFEAEKKREENVISFSAKIPDVTIFCISTDNISAEIIYRNFDSK